MSERRGKVDDGDVLLDFGRPVGGPTTVLGVLPEASGSSVDVAARDHVRFTVEMKRAAADTHASLERVGIADGGIARSMGFDWNLTATRPGHSAGRDPELVLEEPPGGPDPAGAGLLRGVVPDTGPKSGRPGGPHRRPLPVDSGVGILFILCR